MIVRLLARWLARTAQADEPVTYVDHDCPHPAGTRCECPWDTTAEDRERGIERRRR